MNNRTLNLWPSHRGRHGRCQKSHHAGNQAAAATAAIDLTVTDWNIVDLGRLMRVQ